MTRRLLLAALPLAAGRWDRSGFPDWPSEHASKLLTDSPWAKPAASRFRFRFPGNRFAQIGEHGSLGAPKWDPPRSQPNPAPRVEEMPAQTEANLTVRFASALPLRQARALLECGKDGLQSPRAQALLHQDPGEYVIEIAGFPTSFVTQGVRKMEAQLLDSAELLVKGKRPLRAISASVPEHGMHLMATLRFPAFAAIDAGEGVITVTAKAGAIAIDQRFSLRDMIYSGRLEL